MDTPPEPRAIQTTDSHSVPHIFSPEFRREVRTMTYVRAEIALTIVIDGALILLAVLVRSALLWGLHLLAAPDSLDWSLRIVEFVLNFGLVGTVVIVTGFDLLKRIRNGYLSWKNSE